MEQEQFHLNLLTKCATEIVFSKTGFFLDKFSDWKAILYFVINIMSKASEFYSLFIHIVNIPMVCFPCLMRFLVYRFCLTVI